MSSGSRNDNNTNRTPLCRCSVRARSTRSTRSSNSTVSGLTTPNSRGHTSNAESEPILDATAGLLQLGVANVPLPLRPFGIDPLQQEEAIEGKMYCDTPGNGDTENEMDDKEDDLDAQIDQLTHEFDQRVATIESSDFIPSGNPFQPALYGAPLGWKPPDAPADWSTPESKDERGVPSFESVDNPGKWSSFTYRSKFKLVKGKRPEYLYHALPTGVTC